MGRIASSIKPPNDGADTGTSYVIWADACFFQHFQYTYFSTTFSTSTSQHKPNLGALCLGGESEKK